jgi:hypothetical protein
MHTLFDALGDLCEETEDLHYEIKDLREENRRLRARLSPPA